MSSVPIYYDKNFADCQALKVHFKMMKPLLVHSFPSRHTRKGRSACKALALRRALNMYAKTSIM
jgi:hypothetical protein